MRFKLQELKNYYQKYVNALSGLIGDKKVIDHIMGHCFMYNRFYVTIKPCTSLRTTVPKIYRDQEMYTKYASVASSMDRYLSIPSQYIDPTVAFAMITKDNYESYRKIPDNVWDQELVDKVVEHGEYLYKIPKRLQTKEICLKMVEYDKKVSNILSYIRDDLRSKEICERCMKIQTNNWKYVPHEFLSKKWYLETLKDSKETGYIHGGRRYNRTFQDFPANLKTDKDFILDCVEVDPSITYILPGSLLTKDFVVQLVDRNWKILEYLPSKKKLKKPCVLAMEISPLSLQFIPKRYKTKEMCENCFNENANCFQYIPQEHMNEEMCLIAVKENGMMLSHVPTKYKTDLICLEALRSVEKEKRDSMFNAIPCGEDFKRDKSFYEEILKINPFYIKFVPDSMDLWTEEIARKWVEKGRSLTAIPDRYVTEDMWAAYLKNYCCSYESNYWIDLPDKFKTVAFYSKVVKAVYKDEAEGRHTSLYSKPDPFQYIPEQFHDDVYLSLVR